MYRQRLHTVMAYNLPGSKAMKEVTSTAWLSVPGVPSHLYVRLGQQKTTSQGLQKQPIIGVQPLYSWAAQTTTATHCQSDLMLLYMLLCGHVQGGPPLARAVVRPFKKPRVPRLQPGQLLTLEPSSGGRALARLRLRRGAKRLFVVAVACGANLKLQILSSDGSRVASVAGGQGALHLKLRQNQPSALKMVMTTNPPGAARTLLLAASTSAKGLPLPRLPRNTVVSTIKASCNNVTLQWKSASGNPNYCIMLQEDFNPGGHHIRALAQCDWEDVLQHPVGYLISQCNPGAMKARRQRYLVDHLLPAHAYIATILVQHPITRHVLALKPTYFKTKEDCSL
ncbi:unnamed protein product [Meganyctiphanes norvegica]|uniref:Uncharacterized protein n=1 Tax=Meganyctiphanes norvegica TaxID=48144 RepID=A0AAV2QG24_MEGNR